MNQNQNIVTEQMTKAGQNIEHRLTKPRTPQTNGMVERFNGRISDVLGQTRFKSLKELEDTMNKYAKVYNHHIPQKALEHTAPIDAMKNWQQSHPDLFKKKVYKQAGLDSYSCHAGIGRS